MAEWKKINISGSRVNSGPTFIEGSKVFRTHQNFALETLTGTSTNGAGWEYQAVNKNGTNTSWINGAPSDPSQPGNPGSEAADANIINGWRVGWDSDGTDADYSGNTGPYHGPNPTTSGGLTLEQVSGKKYLFTEASSGGPFDYQLTTPKFDVLGRNDLLFVFYGHAWGSAIGTLTCTATSEDGVNTDIPLYIRRAVESGETEWPAGSGTGMTAPFLSQTGQTPNASGTSDFLRYEVSILDLSTWGPSRLHIKFTTTGTWKGDFAIANAYLSSTEPTSFPALSVDGGEVEFMGLSSSDPGVPGRLWKKDLGSTGNFLKIST